MAGQHAETVREDQRRQPEVGCKVTVTWVNGKPAWGTGTGYVLPAIKMADGKIGSMGIG